MKLTRIEIKDVYNIKNANLDLSNGCALVVGPNGCGKTNIIKCIVQVLEKAADEVACSSHSNQKFQFREMQPKNIVGYSFINLSFNFNETERKIFMQLRMIAITTNVLHLCNLLQRRTASHANLTKKFWDEIFPSLLKVLSSSCAELNQWHKRRNSADLTVSQFEPPVEFRGIGLCKTQT